MKLECKRCGYKWIPRAEEVRICPKCHSSWWDVEKENKDETKVE